MGRIPHAARQSPQGELQACMQCRIAHKHWKRYLTINTVLYGCKESVGHVSCGLALCSMVWYGCPCLKTVSPWPFYVLLSTCRGIWAFCYQYYACLSRYLTINTVLYGCKESVFHVSCALALCSMVWYGFPMPQDGFPMVILRTVVNLQRYLGILLSVLRMFIRILDHQYCVVGM